MVFTVTDSANVVADGGLADAADHCLQLASVAAAAAGSSVPSASMNYQIVSHRHSSSLAGMNCRAGTSAMGRRPAWTGRQRSDEGRAYYRPNDR